MRNKFFAALSGTVLMAGLFVSPAHADEMVDQMTSGEGTYGAAGCGLGAVVFGDADGAAQIIAATLNAFSGSQMFGLTFGTSNCGSGLLGANGAQVYIEANREALAKDISRGAGETIDGLAAIAGCTDASAVGVTLQSDFANIFPSETASSEAVTEAVLEALSSEALTCSYLG